MHINRLIEKYPVICPIQAELRNAVGLLVNCYKKGSKILTCGNGGSAADAGHIVGELVKGFLLPRKLPVPLMDKLKEHGLDNDLCQNLQMGIPAISLAAGVSLPTAIANDTGYEYVFAQQVFILGNAGDILMAISTSGNSSNVVKAAQVAKATGLNVISLTGANSGKLSAYSDILIQVPSMETPYIQEMHVAIYHAICADMERMLFGQ